MFERKLYLSISILLITILSLALAACSKPSTPKVSAGAVTLRMALLPVLDTLPIYVAQQEGLFAQQDLIVELIPVASATERDQIIAAERADGMINEALSTALYNQDQIQIQIVRYARVATPEQPLFRILAAQNSEIRMIEDLKGVPVGISEGTAIEYLNDRLLQAQGFTPDEIKIVAVPKISDRMALLDSGELEAAMLSEPLSSLAVQQGARLILDDTSHPEYSFSTIAFRKSVIDQHPNAIRGFLAAFEAAVDLINAAPDKYTSVLSDQNLVPPHLVDSFNVPTFARAGVPTQEQWEDMLSWAKQKGLLSEDVPYQGSVDASFLP
jgi:NitT/TauT family transport system substrate-binding protein